jgi:hypothetical protein
LAEFKPADLSKGGVLSSFEPKRPTEKLRRWLLNYFTTDDDQDQVDLQNKINLLERVANLSAIPWLGDVGYAAAKTASKPEPAVERLKEKSWQELAMDAAFLLPAAKGLRVPKFRSPRGDAARHDSR